MRKMTYPTTEEKLALLEDVAADNVSPAKVADVEEILNLEKVLIGNERDKIGSEIGDKGNLNYFILKVKNWG